MRFEPLEKPRSKVRDEPGGLLIEIPSRVNWFAAVFLTAWLGGWAMGEVTVLRRLLFPGDNEPFSFFSLFWIIGWTVGGVVAGFSLLWMIAGKERVLLGSDALVVQRAVLGLGRKRSYDVSLISRLRVAPVESPDRARKSSWSALDLAVSGGIAFDYGPRTIHFAASLDEAEARSLVETLRQRYPFPGDAA